MNTPNSNLQHDNLGFLTEWIIEATNWSLQDFYKMEDKEISLFRSGLRAFSLASVEELIATGEEEETKLMQGAELIESALEKSLGALKGKPAGVRKTKPTGICRQSQPQSSRNIILDGHLELIK